MPKLFAVCPVVGGQPDINTTNPTGANYTPVNGWLQCGHIGALGVYMFSGTGPQLVALNALAAVVGIVAVTEAENVKWAELDDAIAPAVRTKLNTWLTAKSYPNIPVGAKARVVIEAVFKRLNAKFSIEAFDLAE